MSRTRPEADNYEAAFDVYLAALHRLLTKAGSPSSRQVVHESIRCHGHAPSHTTVNLILTGRTLGRTATPISLVTSALTAMGPAGIGGPSDADEVMAAWRKAKAASYSRPSDPPVSTPTASPDVLHELREMRGLLAELVEIARSRAT